MKSPIEMLLDENCSDPIVLFDENNEEVAFDQIAVIPLNGDVYAILKPLGDFEGVAEDEALVFVIAEEDDEDVLQVVEEDEIVDAVFAQYYEMLKEQGIL
jgi:hypothetical protein